MSTTTLDKRRVHAPSDDARDAARAGLGDAHAFERLYRGHVGRVRALASRLIGWDEADEATQDVFVRAWEKVGTFRGDAAFGTWLHRLAVRVILSRREQRATREDRFLSDEIALEQATARPLTPELSLDFEAAVARLPEGARQVFVLHDVEGFKHEEIADLLGIAAGTSKSQLHRARMSLRQYLG